MRGRCEHGTVYPVKLCASSSQAHAITFAGTRASFDRWRHRLGQPSSKLLSSFFHCYNLLSCVSCQYSFYCHAFHVIVISRTNCLLMSLSYESCFS